MSIINPKNEDNFDLSKDPTSQIKQNVKDFINKQVQENKIINNISDTANKAQETINQANSLKNNINKTINATEALTDFPIKSKLPPNFEITTPEISNIVSYSKSLGEGLIIYTQVTIDGLDISKNNGLTVEITQNFAEHDEFEILCPSDAFNENNQYPFSKTKKFLGGTATIQLKQYGETQYIFTGIITEITSKRRDGYTYIVLKGKAPTILLDNGRDCQSFEKMTLEQIISTATKEYNNDLLTLDVRPTLKDNFTYMVQYKESDFDFLRRLAIRYGQFFYYNGTKIVFGGYGGQTVEMIEEQDIYEYELKMKVLPQKFAYTAYGGKQAQKFPVESDNVSVQEPPNPFQFAALKASERIFSKVPTSLFNHSLLENGEMEVTEAVRRQKEYRKNVFYLEAKGNNPNLKLGDIVKLRAWVPEHEIFGQEGVPLERYMVIRLKHYSDGDSYYNEFTAIPHDNTVPPYMDEDAIPLCEEQSAIVIDNHDKEGLSRIRVRFPWQSNDEQTPWLRVVTPYAGNGKGMHILPEIGEEVMVTFENGNAEKPVVLGAMFNGKEKLGFLSNKNNIKSFISNSGHTLLFFDGEKPSITLTDPKQNLIHINTNDDSINISANKKIFISSDNIELTAKENLILGGQHVSISAGNEMSLISRKTTTYTNDSNIECDNFNVNAYQEIKLNSVEDTLLYNKNIKVNSDETTEIKSKIEINLISNNINHKK